MGGKAKSLRPKYPKPAKAAANGDAMEVVEKIVVPEEVEEKPNKELSSSNKRRLRRRKVVKKKVLEGGPKKVLEGGPKKERNLTSKRAARQKIKTVKKVAEKLEKAAKVAAKVSPLKTTEGKKNQRQAKLSKKVEAMDAE